MLNAIFNYISVTNGCLLSEKIKLISLGGTYVDVKLSYEHIGPTQLFGDGFQNVRWLLLSQPLFFHSRSILIYYHFDLLESIDL